eukprot:scpid89229/ scgid12811/ 
MRQCCFYYLSSMNNALLVWNEGGFAAIQTVTSRMMQANARGVSVGESRSESLGNNTPSAWVAHQTVAHLPCLAQHSAACVTCLSQPCTVDTRKYSAWVLVLQRGDGCQDWLS